MDGVEISPESRVIVRGWGGEPVDLVVHRTENKGKTVIVGRNGGTRTVGLPSGDVFRFDAPIFAKLRAAFDAGRTTELQAIYADLEKNKSCNLILDAIDSSHDQERLAHPERTSQGHAQRDSRRGIS